MNKYGISTDVLNTYVADFHGQTIALFEKESPDAQVNKPVCYDCHGVHDISRVDNPSTGLEMQQNLLARCKVCHPDASTNFPTAWMSHYIPSPQHFALVYYVNLFYRYFIPTTLGAMALLVVMDAGRVLINRSRRRRTAQQAQKDETASVEESAGVVRTEESPEKETVDSESIAPAEEPDQKPTSPDSPPSEPDEKNPSDSEVEHG